MDIEDLEDNINIMAIKGNLSPKHIDKLKANHGKQKKKGVGEIYSQAIAKQTRNTVSKFNKSLR